MKPMKKNLIALLLAAMCCFTACEGAESTQSEHSSYTSQEEYMSESMQEGEDSQDSQETTNSTALYTAENLETIAFTDIEKGVTVEVSDNGYLKTLLLETEYQEDPSIGNEGVDVAKYVLVLQGLEMKIYANGVAQVTFKDETTRWVVVLDNKLAYLEELLVGSEVNFNDYTSTQTIKALNAQNADGTITDKEDFLTKLKAVAVVGLNHKEHYEMGAKKYTIKIDNDEIVVYGKYVTINSALYVIQQGNFDFLKSLQYGSTVEGLPWL
jgi:hypothetical protein